MKSKYRWFAAIALLACAGLLLSNAVAHQNRTSAAKSPAVSATPRAASYVAGSFTFTAPQELTGHPPSPAFFQADGEPEITIDIFGNIYVTAIQGVPGGTDLWKSTDTGRELCLSGST